MPPVQISKLLQTIKERGDMTVLEFYNHVAAMYRNGEISEFLKNLDSSTNKEIKIDDPLPFGAW